LYQVRRGCNDDYNSCNGAYNNITSNSDVSFKPMFFFYVYKDLLYTKPTHALLLNTLSLPHFKTLKLFKNVFTKHLLTILVF
jgi:hypothetical protein